MALKSHLSHEIYYIGWLKSGPSGKLCAKLVFCKMSTKYCIKLEKSSLMLIFKMLCPGPTLGYFDLIKRCLFFQAWPPLTWCCSHLGCTLESPKECVKKKKLTKMLPEPTPNTESESQEMSAVSSLLFVPIFLSVLEIPSDRGPPSIAAHFYCCSSPSSVLIWTLKIVLHFESPREWRACFGQRCVENLNATRPQTTMGA